MRADDLIPWQIRYQHRWAHPLAMLWIESRRRAGFEPCSADRERVAAFKQELASQGWVVHYEPRTEQGWWLVPRRRTIDRDLIREPDKRTARPALVTLGLPGVMVRPTALGALRAYRAPRQP